VGLRRVDRSPNLESRAGGVLDSSRRPTILDVAARCGLSPATVSNALAGKPHVRAETRALVHQTVAELGYRASTVAQTLRMRRSWSIGLLIGDISNPYVSDLVRGVEEVAWRQKTSLILCNTDFNADKKTAYLRSLLDKQIDGLIFASQVLNAEEKQALDLERVPFVVIGRKREDLTADCVGVDNAAGISMAVDYLARLGHRRIAFVKGLAASVSALDRFTAYRAAIHSIGLDADPDLVSEGDYSLESGSAAARRLMAVTPAPTAIVAANDVMAIGALGALHEMGVRVPKDVSVAGFDDIYLAKHPLVNLTTVHQPMHETGSSAAKLLLARILGETDAGEQSVVLRPSLVVRGTTGPPRPAAGKPRRRTRA
jgi:DNA-binding LacI/PurR family transcriptional regulator